MTVSITYGGQHHNLEYDELGVTEQNTDAEIINRVAWALDTDEANIRKLQLIRLEDGNVSIQPHARYG